jgi:hypothetical protein
LLAWVDDRLRSEFVQHPTHPAELRRGQGEGNSDASQLGFHTEMAPLLLAIVQENVAHDPGVEVRERRGFNVAVFALLYTNNPCPSFLVPNNPAQIVGRASGALLREEMPIGVVVRPKQHDSKFHA